MSKLRIGHIPNGSDMVQSTERRRLVYWAKPPSHRAILDLRKMHDVLVFSGRGDLTGRSKMKKRSLLSLNLVDVICQNPDEWHKMITELMESVELRKKSVEKGQLFICGMDLKVIV